MDTPYLRRLYHTRGLFTKVAYDGERPFLIGRRLDDIALESYGGTGTRPLVAFSSGHEGLEKSLWCYSKNILPLVGDDDPDITAMLSARFEADALITDSETLASLLPSLARYYALDRFRSVSVVDTAFNLSLIRRMFRQAAVSLVLGLPETGAIACACADALREGRTYFHAAPAVRIERERELTFTRDALLPTPLIRYQPGLSIRFVEHPCECDSDATFELTP